MITLHVLEAVIWGTAISLVSFATGMLFVAVLAVKEQRRTENINRIGAVVKLVDT